MRETDTHIYFWGSFLSNFIPNNLHIDFDNIIFTNSEQLYMYLKAIYFKDFDKAKEIVNFGNEPRIAKNLGREVRGYNDIEWAKVREVMMYTACILKFKSDTNLAKKLLDTNNKILVEASPVDLVWGIGIKWDNDDILDETNWKGLNLLGKVLMKVREELK